MHSFERTAKHMYIFLFIFYLNSRKIIAIITENFFKSVRNYLKVFDINRTSMNKIYQKKETKKKKQKNQWKKNLKNVS